uniref:Hypoxanthine phosphoribosyltransferase n=1 Tax=Chlamydomonas leiostraca TaxID=1034604 RepID=A0A7S0REN9_9CHLO|eukprot:CAMPEP_0202868876 /NCGR_PEP_ID=MMETSP1391-20130828/11282_1 /ASSEMBLY_ACC=CAM_ASM_000867 /TAXON_ID=1034604 /ORGANISM="Chlamydomonas leiostraca, Strain SAG 11-49" /LENGTH=196 /DNA_ID=CAMNT_0049549093 /DNA_START=42 /DNA_END=632 /DNA_ORIENTATION=-
MSSSQDRRAAIHPDVDDVLFTEQQIRDKIEEMGTQIAQDYAALQPMVMPILKGGFIVAADLLRALHPTPEGMVVEFVHASSYGAGTETSGRVEVSFNRDVVKGRHVLLVDDLCDSGLTLLEVARHVAEAGAATVKSMVLLDKAERRRVDYVPDYVGFACPNRWIVGHGMDTAQIYRSLPYIGVLRPEVQARFKTKP